MPQPRRGTHPRSSRQTFGRGHCRHLCHVYAIRVVSTSYLCRKFSLLRFHTKRACVLEFRCPIGRREGDVKEPKANYESSRRRQKRPTRAFRIVPGRGAAAGGNDCQAWNRNSAHSFGALDRLAHLTTWRIRQGGGGGAPCCHAQASDLPCPAAFPISIIFSVHCRAE